MILVYWLMDFLGGKRNSFIRISIGAFVLWASLFVPLCHAEASAEKFTLYNSSDVGITILTTANFSSTLFTKLPSQREKEQSDAGQNLMTTDNYVWFIQFYNSWCGHCQVKFANFQQQIAVLSFPVSSKWLFPRSCVSTVESILQKLSLKNFWKSDDLHSSLSCAFRTTVFFY